MSFILDALKKSENERQRQVGPSLADVRVGRPRSDKPWWAVAVGALLVLNLGVLIYVLARNDDTAASKQAPPAAAPAPTVAAPSVQAAVPAAIDAPHVAPRPANPTAAPSPAVRSLADEAGALEPTDPRTLTEPELAGAATVPDGPPLVRAIDPPAVAPAPAQRAAATRDDEVLPTLNDLAASGTTLPPLHLDIHVYSGNPAERFVLVNMRKYVEGETLSEGPAVERINAEGVVLNHRGLRFLLPRS